jgi:Kef-type K+ transport system membrane component KefB
VSSSLDVIPHFFITLIVVVLTAKLAGYLFYRLKQPAVMGEVVGGLALGPSFLGIVWPEAREFLLAPPIVPFINVVSQVGIVIFMFLVGVELNKTLLHDKGRAALIISNVSIICPFLFGVGVSLGLYKSYAPPETSLFIFSLFMGVALSITAFPVLARIITDLKISESPLAALTLTCAAINDVTAWCLLAFLIGIAKGSLFYAVIAFTGTLAFAAAAIFIGGPLMKKLVEHVEAKGLSLNLLLFVTALVALSGYITDLIGIHSLFGAFIFGTLIPHDCRLAKELDSRFKRFVLTLLLPMFFAFTGMRTQISLLNTPKHWLWCAVIICVAISGKFGGSTLAARWSGHGWRDAIATGLLMNTRGLVELVILNVGLDLGVISPILFTIMVIMAVVTTLMTTPLFILVTRSKPWTAA